MSGQHVIIGPSGERLSVGTVAFKYAMRYMSDPSFAARVDNTAGAGFTRAKNVIDKIQKGWKWATNKRARTGSAEPVASDPLSVSSARKIIAVPGSRNMFTGGVPSEPSASMRLTQPVYHDNVAWLMSMLNRKATMNLEAQVQILGDSEQRSVHMFTYRHRGTTLSNNNYLTDNTILRPFNNTGYHYPKVDGTFISSNVSTYFLDLNVGATPDASNGKCFYSPVNMADLENQSFALMAPFINKVSAESTLNADVPEIQTALFNQSNPLSAINSPYMIKSADIEASGAGTQYNPNIPTWNRPIIRPMICDGGVKMSFSNKGPTGAFIEIIVIKKKQKNEPATPIDAVYDSVFPMKPLRQYARAINDGYVVQKQSSQGVVMVGGDSPGPSDTFSNPYVKLLPESRYCKAEDVQFTQKERMKFGIPSGGNKDVSIKFGGYVSSGRTYVNGDQFCDSTISILVAINGQLQSAELSKNGDNLVTGNLCSPHNVMIDFDYHETMQASKQSLPPKKAYIRGKVNPYLLTQTLPAGVVAHPFQMIAAEKILRDGQTNGRRQHAQDGDMTNDDIKNDAEL